MEKIEIREINESYNDEILEIIRRSPINTNQLKLNFDRSPDFFALSNAGFDYSRYAGLFINDTLKGFVGTSYYNGLVNGQEESIIYYTNLYVLPEARKRGFFFSSSEVLLKEKYNNARIGLTVVMKGNEDANRLIGRRSEEHPYSFYSKVCGALTVKNILITLPKKRSTKINVRNATIEDIDTIVNLLDKSYQKRTFAPIVNRETFITNIDKRPDFTLENYFLAERDNKVVGVCAAMDINNMKRTRVIEYKGKFRFIRFAYLLLKPLFGLPRLPKRGESFKDITLIDHACENNDPEIMESLLRTIYMIYRKLEYNTIIFGSYENDPLLKASDRFHTTSVESNILLGCESDELIRTINVEKPYVNTAFL